MNLFSSLKLARKYYPPFIDQGKKSKVQIGNLPKYIRHRAGMSKTQDKIPDLWISVEGNLIKHKYISHTQISTKGSRRLDFENEEINKISHIIKRVYLQECKK